MCLVSCRAGFLGGDILLSTFPGKDGPFLCITEVMDFVLQFQSVTGLVVNLAFTFTARLVAV